jgi:hypothetical protein
MKRAIWMAACVAMAGCGGAGDPVGEREAAVTAAASPDDVAQLGVDDEACADAVADGGRGVPVVGRPDLVGVVLGEGVVCVTTVELAQSSLPLTWLSDFREAVPMSAEEAPDEPEPLPYVEGDDGTSGKDEEPEPLPYDGDKSDTGGSDSSDSSDG